MAHRSQSNANSSVRRYRSVCLKLMLALDSRKSLGLLKYSENSILFLHAQA